MSRPLRILFAVQGEGRGHMTQALALREALAEAGHTLCGVLVGRSAARKPPAFFAEQIGAPVHFFDSPNFVYDPRTHAVRLGRTMTRGLRRGWLYGHTLQLIGRQIAAKKPDVVVNFYEGMLGLYALAARPEVPVVCVGHQYMFGHPSYRFAAGQRMAKTAMRSYTWLTAAGAAKRLALSFYPAEDRPAQRLRVLPPLLRREVFELDHRHDDGYLLVYLLNSGYAEHLEAWHRRRPEVPLHVFWDRGAHRPHPNLTYHPLSGERFLRMMARARGVVCTAGFETVSESMLLEKPVYMVPTAGHFEQRSNARDACRAGAGLYGTGFDLDGFLRYLPTHRPPAFRAWARQACPMAVAEIEAAAQRPRLHPVPMRPLRLPELEREAA